MEFEDGVEELKQLFDSSNQTWFLGAGVSFLSGIPLMDGLTDHVRSVIKERNAEIHAIIETLLADLPSGSHVEHLLSQLGDLIAIARRSKTSQATLADTLFHVRN